MIWESGRPSEANIETAAHIGLDESDSSIPVGGLVHADEKSLVYTIHCDGIRYLDGGNELSNHGVLQLTTQLSGPTPITKHYCSVQKPLTN